MKLLQNSVIRKYLKGTEEKINTAYEKFTKYFHNLEIQENIRNSKEEQFQEGFLRELFVKVLGYTINPDPNYNLITEKKNEEDARKADAAILLDNEVIGVIELKDGKTTDLKTVEGQVFGYKNNHKNAVYVIISNFEKLRFYIDTAVEYIEFNLFTLNKEDFAILWLCLECNNILKNLPKQIKDESVSSEDQITKNLYREYSTFKRDLFNDLLKNNTNYDKLTLFKKSQKLLDRLLFILFAEDRGLLPPNSVKTTINQWKQLNELDEKIPLYNRFKKYFGYLNSGFKGKQYDVYPYNGGLFEEDKILDNIKISDDILHKHMEIIQNYDFSSEIDVNILGHIFENSLTEIEEITNAINNNTEIQTSGKRKKDGVFYTPRYITNFIVENTIGKLCIEKKEELGIDEEEYFSDKTRQKATKTKLENKLIEYRNWLLSLTICAPACGSGAFLNAALDFLIEEHRNIDEMRAKIFGGDYQLFENIENAILENNLFGVDINDESVEIAKLSLWLRTARPNRKLNVLNENIKCGNSLIDDKEIAGEKAFDWKNEFPNVFKNGGFDVVIGNPPYVNAKNMNILERNYLVKRYDKLEGAWDLYTPFLLKGIEISKNKIYGWIIPNKLMINDYAKKTLEYLKINNLKLVVNVSQLEVFENVGVYPIIIIGNNINDDFMEYKITNISNLIDIKEYKKVENVFNRYKTFKDFGLLINSGTTGFEAQKIIPLINENNKGIRFAVSGSVDPYLLDTTVVTYMKTTYKNPTIELDKNVIADSKINFWNNEKIIIAGMTKRLEAYYSKEPLALGVGVYGIYHYAQFLPLFLLAVLNSKFLTYYLKTEFHDKHLAGGYLAINKSTIDYLPLVEISKNDQQPLADLAEKMLSFNNNLQDSRNNFIKRITDNLDNVKITGKLEKFDELDFKQFLSELKKQKIEISLKQQGEWNKFFDDEKLACNTIVEHIQATDKNP